MHKGRFLSLPCQAFWEETLVIRFLKRKRSFNQNYSLEIFMCSSRIIVSAAAFVFLQIFKKNVRVTCQNCHLQCLHNVDGITFIQMCAEQIEVLHGEISYIQKDKV